jgi:type IV secretion system protein VirD4
MARRAIAATLQLPERTRESVVATAQSYVASMQSASIEKALATSSLDLGDFARGEPMTVYICMPPTKLRSHASLLRLWIGAFLAAACSRGTNPMLPTWFFLDECAQLGYWPQLEQVLTLLRGYGVQAATFWQDLSQLKNL